MIYTASNELADLYQSILQCASLADFQTVQKTVKMLGALPPAATPDPVAPPSPDIAGLVPVAWVHSGHLDQVRHGKDPEAVLWHDAMEAAHVPLYDLDALQRVAQERDAANAVRRWNIDRLGNGVLQVCRDNHDRGEKCDWETFVSEANLVSLRRELEVMTAECDAANAEIARLQAIVGRNRP
jgi:hypothetical protein